MWFSPLRYKSVQITLIEFVIPKSDNQPGSDNPLYSKNRLDSNNQLGPDKQLGVALTLTHNFLNNFFFLVYGVMILALAGYTAMTLKRT